ncbi:MAG: bacteriophage holin [Candidatus Aceula meridiana]|nr:bacteriophage holin [Candidatus Aceula meridiana]
MAKLDVKAFGLACGILWAAVMLILGIINIFCGWGSELSKMMASLYIGYKPTILGSLIGAAWGFADAGIGGVALAWLYNKLAKA